jgi:hypothetical protein
MFRPEKENNASINISLCKRDIAIFIVTGAEIFPRTVHSI